MKRRLKAAGLITGGVIAFVAVAALGIWLWVVAVNWADTLM